MRKLMLTMFLSLVAAAANATTLTEKIDRTFDVRAGAELTLDNVNGRIEIASWDQPRIRVQAVKTVERADAADAKAAMAALRVDMTATPDRVTVKTVQPKNQSSGLWDLLLGHIASATVQYTVTVPRTTNLHVDNTNGRVQLTSVNGLMDVETTNGSVELNRCAGSANVETTNGHIRAELGVFNPQKQSRFETTNGKIELVVPANIAADVDAETTNGSVSSDLPVTTRSSGRNSLHGTLNGGGAEVRLRTTNGSIAIHVAH